MSSYQDIIEGAIGEFGLAQIIIFVACKLGWIAASWPMVMMSFAGATPDWWRISRQWNSTGNGSWVTVKDEKVCPTSSNQTIKYENLNSIVGEWDLICDRKWIPSTITTIQMVGVLVGAGLVGQLGDWIGRKKTLILSFGVMLLFTLVSGFAQNWQTMAACRFLIGLALGGYLIISFLYPVEFIGTSWRTIIGAFPMWPIGVILFGLFSVFVKHWRNLAYGATALGIPMLISMFFIPESIRWLLVKGRHEEAEAVLQKLARWNRREVPMLDKLDEALHAEMRSDSETHTYWTVVKNKSTRYNVIACSAFWFTCAFVYYGLTFGISRLSGNASLNMILFGIVEICALVSNWLVAKQLARRRTLLMWFISCGVLSFSITIAYFISDSAFEKAMNWLAICARFALAAAWNTSSMCTSELFPTAVRTLGYGFASVAGRVGGIAGSQVDNLNDLVIYLPYTIYAGCVFVCAGLAFFLKDTYHSQLDDFLVPDQNRVSVELPAVDAREDGKRSGSPEPLLEQ